MCELHLIINSTQTKPAITLEVDNASKRSWLSRLKLDHFRNYQQADLTIHARQLVIFGDNGAGKTNLLEAVSLLSPGRGMRRAKSQNERIDLADEEDLVPRVSLGDGMPDEQLDMQRFGDLLAARLEGVADWQAEIFEMRHFENLSIPEISERTARSSDAVRSSLYRVKRLFFDAAAANVDAMALAGGTRR